MPSFATPTLLGMLALLLAAMVCVAPGEGIAQDREAAIESVISGQLEAFRRNDKAAAWAFAAPSIQKQFGNPDRFMEMVSNHYPQIFRSTGAEFAGVRDIQGNVIQRVLVRSGPNEIADAYYTLKLINGRWRISGCVIAKPGQGV